MTPMTLEIEVNLVNLIMMDINTSACRSCTTSSLKKLASCGANSWMTSMKNMDSVAVAYIMFGLSAVACIIGVNDMNLSSFLTLSLGLQCLAFASLAALVDTQRGLQGVSIKMVSMYAGVSAVRLCSTTMKQGYLPDDKTGDYIYQMCDVVSLFIAVGLIVQSKGKYSWTYKADADSLNVLPAVAASVIMAILIHGDLNNSPFFDTVWMTSLNLDTAAMVPQLWMLSKVGGKVPPLMGHFIASSIAVLIATCYIFCLFIVGHIIAVGRKPVVPLRVIPPHENLPVN